VPAKSKNSSIKGKAQRNCFGLLGEDGGPDFEKLREFVGSAIEWPHVGGETLGEREDDGGDWARDAIVALAEVADLACELHSWDGGKARDWVMTRNDYFFGRSPFEEILLGSGDAVAGMLCERLGRTREIVGQMPTVDTALNWLRSRWLTNDATNIFTMVSAATKKSLADARAEIATTLNSDEEKLDFYKFCSRCGFSDSPDWESSRAKKFRTD
jgi:hypothetical protein